ncbi:hypothetical protein ElyMa_006916100 [Elysia marginata]|uniref:Uncharacterized protein n=1 Tax=Elysia marginata TaxID=1093978 RepID=A0AAV4JKN4_9GAST|nr:hypothetical protein ElyMa_006916100 [Elysia marginata]
MVVIVVEVVVAVVVAIVVLLVVVVVVVVQVVVVVVVVVKVMVKPIQNAADSGWANCAGDCGRRVRNSLLMLRMVNSVCSCATARIASVTLECLNCLANSGMQSIQ